MSVQHLAGALHSELTSPNTQWFELVLRKNGAIDDVLASKDEIKEWLQESSHRMNDVFNNSNFQTEIHQWYLDLVSLCTSVLLVEEDDDFVVRFAAKHIKNIYISENNKGIVDEVFREFEWNAANIVKEFGSNAVPDKIKKAFESGDSTLFKIIHAVYPNRVDKDGLDAGGKLDNFAFISHYVVDCGASSYDELAADGFKEMPYIVSRWEKYSGEIYGRGPGFTALPEAKIVNKMTETIIMASQKIVDPPLQAPDDGFIMPLRTTPGGLNFYRAGTQDMIKPVFDNARLDIGFEALESHQLRIREAFYIDQLQLVQKDRMTATESIQRTEENNRILSPLLGRQHHEFLRPLIDRVFNIMMRRGMFSDPPPELEGIDIDVQYSSSIARSQRAGELNTMLRTLEALSPIASIKPEIFDWIDVDGFAHEVFRIMNFNQKAVSSEKDVEALRQGKIQAQEEMIERQRAQSDAGVAVQEGQAAASMAQALG